MSTAPTGAGEGLVGPAAMPNSADITGQEDTSKLCPTETTENGKECKAAQKVGKATPAATAANGDVEQAGEGNDAYPGAVSRNLNSFVDPELEALDGSWQSVTEKERQEASAHAYHSHSGGSGSGHSLKRLDKPSPHSVRRRSFLVSANHVNELAEEMHGGGSKGLDVGMEALSANLVEGEANEEEAAAYATAAVFAGDGIKPHSTQGMTDGNALSTKGHMQVVSVPAVVVASTGRQSTSRHSFINTASVRRSGSTIPLHQFAVAAAAAAGVMTTSLAKVEDAERCSHSHSCTPGAIKHDSDRKVSLNASRGPPHRVMTLEEAQRLRQPQPREQLERFHVATTSGPSGLGGHSTTALPTSTSTATTTRAAGTGGGGLTPTGIKGAAMSVTAGAPSTFRHEERERWRALSGRDSSASMNLLNTSTASAGHRVMSEEEVTKLLVAKQAAAEVARQVQRQQMKEQHSSQKPATWGDERLGMSGGRAPRVRNGMTNMNPAASRADRRAQHNPHGDVLHSTPSPIIVPTAAAITVAVPLASQPSSAADGSTAAVAANDMRHQLQGFVVRNAIGAKVPREGTPPPASAPVAAASVDVAISAMPATATATRTQRPPQQQQQRQQGFYSMLSRPQLMSNPYGTSEQNPMAAIGGVDVTPAAIPAGAIPNTFFEGSGSGGQRPSSLANSMGTMGGNYGIPGYAPAVDPVTANSSSRGMARTGTAYPGLGMNAVVAGLPSHGFPFGATSAGSAEAANVMLNQQCLRFLTWQQQQQQQQQQWMQSSRTPATRHHLVAGGTDGLYDGNTGVGVTAGSSPYNFASYDAQMACAAGYGFYGSPQATSVAASTAVVYAGRDSYNAPQESTTPPPSLGSGMGMGMARGTPERKHYTVAVPLSGQREGQAYPTPMISDPWRQQQQQSLALLHNQQSGAGSDPIGFSVSSTGLAGEHGLPTILPVSGNEAYAAGNSRQNTPANPRQQVNMQPLQTQPYAGTPSVAVVGVCSDPTAWQMGNVMANNSATENRVNRKQQQQTQNSLRTATGGKGGNDNNTGGKRNHASGHTSGTRRRRAGEDTSGRNQEAAPATGKSKNRSSHDNTPQDQKYYQSDPFSMYKHNKQVLLAAAREGAAMEGGNVSSAMQTTR